MASEAFTNIVALLAASPVTPASTVDEIRAELKGKTLACYCPEGAPCHGDVLLAIANAAPDIKWVLHLYGARRDRAESEAVQSHIVRTADRIVHHWRPYTAAVLRPHTVLPPIPGSRVFKWLHLAVIGALVFVLAVVVWNVAVRP